MNTHSHGGLECPNCGHAGADNLVVNTRRAVAGGKISQYRRRACSSCNFRWNTLEVSATMFKYDVLWEKME